MKGLEFYSTAAQVIPVLSLSDGSASGSSGRVLNDQHRKLIRAVAANGNHAEGSAPQKGPCRRGASWGRRSRASAAPQARRQPSPA